MATVTFKGNPIHTNGDLPSKGTTLSNFSLVASDLSEKSLSDYQGKRLILNIFPSIDTGVCAASVRHFNKVASELKNTVVLCISKDLPFAASRFCGAEGISNVETLSGFRSTDFDALKINDGPLKGLYSRGIIVTDEHGKIIHTEQVSEIGQEPNYAAALAALN
ncbi:MAG: thiol peroxidase [Chitinophagales bacterium]|nr:thiol peroxidase [Chitinophagales bacterium]